MSFVNGLVPALEIYCGVPAKHFRKRSDRMFYLEKEMLNESNEKANN